MDFLSPLERSQRMARIRGKDTAPEISLRKAMHARGLRFRLHRKDLPGKPDIVLPKYNSVVFVHGCFWHRHEGCKVATTPKSNTQFWVDKFDKNIARDSAAIVALQKLGWRVIVIWECEVSTPKKAEEAAKRIDEQLKGL